MSRTSAEKGDRNETRAAGTSPPVYTSRLWFLAAPMNEVKSGWGANGRDYSSGWYCTPMNHGWSGISTISGRMPSGDMPEKRKPTCSSRSL